MHTISYRTKSTLNCQEFPFLRKFTPESVSCRSFARSLSLDIDISTFCFGLGITQLDDFTLNLLTNDEVLTVKRSSIPLPQPPSTFEVSQFDILRFNPHLPATTSILEAIEIIRKANHSTMIVNNTTSTLSLGPRHKKKK